MPIVKLSLAMRKLQPGQQIEVEATDLAFQIDLQAWTRQLGHRLVEFTPGQVQKAVIEKVGVDGV